MPSTASPSPSSCPSAAASPEGIMRFAAGQVAHYNRRYGHGSGGCRTQAPADAAGGPGAPDGDARFQPGNGTSPEERPLFLAVFASAVSASAVFASAVFASAVFASAVSASAVRFSCLRFSCPLQLSPPRSAVAAAETARRPGGGGATRSREPQRHHRAHRSGHGGRFLGGSGLPGGLCTPESQIINPQIDRSPAPPRRVPAHDHVIADGSPPRRDPRASSPVPHRAAARQTTTMSRSCRPGSIDVPSLPFRTRAVRTPAHHEPPPSRRQPPQRG